jgi:surface carbohydrate biosynthesis protein (TIGR04326 family)
MTNIVIWDRNEAPSQEGKCVILWRAYGATGLDEYVSIPQYVEANSVSLRHRYLAWIYSLGETKISGRRLIDLLGMKADFSIWWMNPIVEKCNYHKSVWINEAIKLMAFDEWASGREITSVQLSSANSDLAECVKAWCSKSGVSFKREAENIPRKTASYAHGLYRNLPMPLRGLLWLVRHLFSRWALCGVGVSAWRKSSARISFVSYLLYLNQNALSKGRYESGYWASLPDKLRDAGYDTNWLHIYVKDSLAPSARQAAKLLKEFNRNANGTQVHVSLHSFLSAKVVVRTVVGWARVALLSVKLEPAVAKSESKGLVLWPMLRTEWNNSMTGPTALSNQLYVNLFYEALRQLPRQERGVYLQENMDWEYAFLAAWKDAGHGTSIGSPHSTVRYWDLRYFSDPRCYIRSPINSMPMPDKVGVNGSAALATYREGEYPKQGLVEVEALRYLHLLEHQRCNKGAHRRENRHIRLLVMGDYSKRHTELQMRLLVSAARLLQIPDYVSVIVKPHISFPIAAHDYPQLPFEVSMEPIADLLQKCDIAFTSSVTSAAVDAYCAGVPVIVVLDPEFPNLSPLRGREDVQYASTPKEFVDAVTTAAEKPPFGDHASSYFRLDADLPAWMTLLTQHPEGKSRDIETSLKQERYPLQ